METALIAKAFDLPTDASFEDILAACLCIPTDASHQDILDNIANLRAAREEVDVEALDNFEMMQAGLHPNVTITPRGADITLYTPIMSGSEEIASLSMRRPTLKIMGEMDESKKGNLKKVAKACAELCGKTDTQFDKLDGADVDLLVDVFRFLRRPPRRTGAKS